LIAYADFRRYRYFYQLLIVGFHYLSAFPVCLMLFFPKFSIPKLGKGCLAQRRRIFRRTSSPQRFYAADLVELDV